MKFKLQSKPTERIVYTTSRSITHADHAFCTRHRIFLVPTPGYPRALVPRSGEWNLYGNVSAVVGRLRLRVDCVPQLQVHSRYRTTGGLRYYISDKSTYGPPWIDTFTYLSIFTYRNRGYFT